MADKSTLDAKALSKLKCTSVRNQRFFSFELLISEDTENKLQQLAHQR